MSTLRSPAIQRPSSRQCDLIAVYLSFVTRKCLALITVWTDFQCSHRSTTSPDYLLSPYITGRIKQCPAASLYFSLAHVNTWFVRALKVVRISVHTRVDWMISLKTKRDSLGSYHTRWHIFPLPEHYGACIMDCLLTQAPVSSSLWFIWESNAFITTTNPQTVLGRPRFLISAVASRLHVYPYQQLNNLWNPTSV